MAATMKTIHANGAAIPALGFGTWPLRGEACARIVSEGIELGYRHVDTAQGYDNESDVGAGIAASGVPRGEIFIATKVHPDRQSDGDLQASVEESLRKLRVDRLDLTVIHWPNPGVPVRQAIGALCDARRRGLTRHIGLSNFTIALIEEAVAAATEPLVAAQIEYHPFLDQSKVMAALRRHGMATIAYSPLALGRVVGEEAIEAIARAHGKSAAQVTIRWLLQQGDVVAIPKSSSRERLRENFEVFDFELTATEMATMAGLSSRGLRLVNEPGWVPRWD